MQIFGEITTSSSVVTLPRYSQLVGYSECAFFGVAHEGNPRYACRELWSKSQRDDIATYLQEAQEAIEAVLEYPLKPRWIADERHVAKHILITQWGKILEVGTKVVEVLSDDVVSNLNLIGADPDIIQVVFISPTVLTDLTEVHVFYPDTDIEILPSNIEYDEGTRQLTISIPRCRMVNYDKLDNPDEGWIYDDNSNFQLTVDVHRHYTDSTIQAKLLYRDNVCTGGCTELSSDACIYVDNPNIGKIRLGVPNKSCQHYSHIELNYKAGVPALNRTMESMIIRLAHSMMPTEPCGCDVTQRLWLRDREVPQILTRERIENPFGMSNGAWIAWKWASGLRLIRMSTTVGKFSI